METQIAHQTFKTFYRSLTPERQKEFASEAKTTTGYIEAHLVYARKVPRKDSMDSLWLACEKFGAQFDKNALLAFFFNGGSSGGNEAD